MRRPGRPMARRISRIAFGLPCRRCRAETSLPDARSAAFGPAQGTNMTSAVSCGHSANICEEPTLDRFQIGGHVLALAIAFALAMPIGWDREKKERSAGLRTFPLVALASCGFVQACENMLGQSSRRHVEGDRRHHHRHRLYRRRRHPQARQYRPRHRNGGEPVGDRRGRRLGRARQPTTSLSRSRCSRS